MSDDSGPQLTAQTKIVIDRENAPITAALAMRFQVMDADIAAAQPADRISVALDEMYNFLGNLVSVVHQLETGKVPDAIVTDEAV